MFLSLVLSIFLTSFLLFFNKRNKFSYLFCIHFIVTAFTLAVASVYISKCSTYPNFSSFDYSLFLRIRKVKLPLSSLSRIYNFCLTTLMMISVFYLPLFIDISHKTIGLLLLPIAFSLIWCDSSTAETMWMLIYTSGNHSGFYNTLYHVINNLLRFVFLIYVLLPVFFSIKAILRSKIFFYRSKTAFIGFFIAAISFFILNTFVYGDFQPIFFSITSGVAKVPLVIKKDINYSKIFLFYIFLLLFVLLIYTIRNNFYRINAMQLSILLRRNITMQLHSYKNAFTSVEMQLNLAKLQLSADNKEACLAHIENGIKTLNNYSGIFVRNLKLLNNNFTDAGCTQLDLIACIEQAISISLDESVEVIRNYPSERIYISGAQQHIVEAFVNIFNNALAAIKKADREPCIQIDLIVEQHWCMAEVTDNGIGIESANRKLIFEPFYSSNNHTSNSGMGLYYVKKIMKSYKGDIRCLSRPNIYTKFQMAFPTIQQDRHISGKHKK